MKSVTWGHNLAPTTETLGSGITTAGIYLLAYGLSDDVTVGVSPWFNHFYKMQNAVLKGRLYSKEGHEVALQSAYFKSVNDAEFTGLDRYWQMEASISNLIYSYRASGDYTVSVNFGYHYYFDETVPFSIRRESFKDSPHQFNISSFHQLKLEDNFSVGLELGVLGMDYLYPQLITGASFNFQSRSWQMQVGISLTGTYAGYISPDRIDNNRAFFEYTSQDKENGRKDFSAHPEIQLQYSF